MSALGHKAKSSCGGHTMKAKLKSNTTTSAPIELQSLVDSHEQPFVVIDRDYRILAVNSAYERAFGTDSSVAIGQACYRVSHRNEAPCHEFGEDCPHVNLFEVGQRDSCLHVHYDTNHRMCQVRVTAYPLIGSDGELYMGELIEELSGPGDRNYEGKRLVGSTPPFMACIDQLKMVATAHAPVLLQGETGTGKELAASYIHRNSSRSDQPFMTVDCTVLTEPLFEAEVFGHARGAFTGSVGERIGLFEQAHGGTLFLDEVGELPLPQQAKLLRVLETGQYRRVGGRSPRKADVRIVCATNRHLWDQVKEGLFREDLYYRIACLAVRLPPLRERIDDISLLAPTLLEPISAAMSRRFNITAAAVDRLKQYDYPGNVRELRNILFIAATHSSHGETDADIIKGVFELHAQSKIQPCPSRTLEEPAAKAAPLPAATPKGPASLQEVEARHIADLLERYDGSRRKTAQAMGISERTLYRKLKRYELM
jgi:two-component system response regulator AtoC